MLNSQVNNKVSLNIWVTDTFLVTAYFQWDD